MYIVFLYKLKFLFPKKKKKKKPNNLNQSYKKEQTIHQKKVERQNTNSFCVERYGLNGRNDIKFIQNKMERKKNQILDRENDKRSIMVKQRAVRI